jgi:hypothetical protein
VRDVPIDVMSLGIAPEMVAGSAIAMRKQKAKTKRPVLKSVG